jgi:hypothetical protein
VSDTIAYVLLVLDLLVGAALIWAVVWVVLRLVAKWRSSTAPQGRHLAPPPVNTNSDTSAKDEARRLG